MSDQAHDRAMAAKHELVSVMREHHVTTTGREPTAKEQRKIEEKARATAERCNRTYRWGERR